MKISAFILSIYLLLNTLQAQTFDSNHIINSYYQHLVINHNNHLVEATIISDFRNKIRLKPGFTDCELDTSMGLWVKDTASNKVVLFKDKCVLITGIDTINSVCWFNDDSKDSTVFMEKIWYAYILHKLGEKRLDIDTIRKIRLLYPEEPINMEKNFVLVKAAFYKDTTIIEKKIIGDIKIQNQVIESFALIAKEKEMQSLEKQIDLITKLPGFECFNHVIYPPLIEYYDGKTEYTYIASKRCLLDKKMYKDYEQIIVLLMNLHPK